MPLQSYDKFSHKMKTIRGSNWLGERMDMDSTSVCQKAPPKNKKKHCISLTDSMLMIWENTLKEKRN